MIGKNDSNSAKRNIPIQYEDKKNIKLYVSSNYSKAELNSNTNLRRNFNRTSVATDDNEIYFKNALATLKDGLDDEQKELFFTNVLEKTEGQELQISSTSIGSRCVELLLETSNDLSAIVRFMHALAERKEDACGNPFASHITEHLLYLGLRHLQNWSADISPDSDSEESRTKCELTLNVLNWVCELGEFCLINIKTCLEDKQASLVLRTLIQVLGGFYVSQSVNQSKRAKEHRKYFEEEYLGSSHANKIKESITLSSVPKMFVDLLKKLAKAFLKLDDIKSYTFEANTSAVLQSFLLVLKHRLPKHSKKFVRAVTAVLFEDKINEGIPLTLLDQNSSFVVEKVFESILESQQEEFWNEHIQAHLSYLVTHNIGNFVIQRLLDVVESATLFEAMSSSVMALFPVILEVRNFGIFRSLASTCNKKKQQQPSFMMNLLQCLGCNATKEAELLLVPLLLGFQTYDDYTQRKSENSDYHMTITLQGSLVIQSMLEFQKPIKVVNSIFNMKSEEIKYMACHLQGCHVLTGFLKSTNVGEKNKDKFVHFLKPLLVPLANDRNGSLTLSRMWVLLSLKQKSVLAQELSYIKDQLKGNPNGLLILKKFGIFHFKNRRDQWKQFQENVAKRIKLEV